MVAAVEELASVAEENSGTTFRSEDDAGVIARIAAVLEDTPGDTIDLVLALDTTQSMEDNIPYLREHLVAMLERVVGARELVRVGVVYYRDYMEEYLTRRFDFAADLRAVQRAVDTIRVAGGRDIPEAVNEALYTAVTRFYWQADSRLVVLVGDAPPHPLPRGSITAEMVQAEAARYGVKIHTIILPQ
ncbi:MAG: VWA domain-containing protein [Spirochaetales bacterium]